MNDKTVAKAAIWAERIRSFQDSGLRRKDWCQQNGIPYPHSVTGAGSWKRPEM